MKPEIKRDSAIWSRVATAVALFIISAAIAGWTNGGDKTPKQFLKSITLTSSSAVLTGIVAAVVFGAAALFAVAATVGVFVAGNLVYARYGQQSSPDLPPLRN
jgi:O-antigen ligase